MRIFVAGATGATGQVFVPLAAGHELLLHVRPKTAPRTSLSTDPRARVFELTDAATLLAELSGCDAVVSFVGTVRHRFREGDTYAASDVGSTRALVGGAVAAGVPRLLLLSSVGAGGTTGAGGPGAYLRMKGESERIVRESPLRFTIFRPSFLVSPPDAAEGLHGARRPPRFLSPMFRALRRVPGLSGFADDLRPIPIAVVARAFLRVLETPMDGCVLFGRDLWRLGG